MVERRGPSDNLCEWFNHDPDRWEEFVDRYHDELDDKHETVDHLRSMAEEGTVTMLYAATDTDHNNAVALKRYLGKTD